MIVKDVKLTDKYLQSEGRVFLTGSQALARLPMLQQERDRLAGLNTAGFISGYRGSPLGGLDKTLVAVSALKATLERHFCVEETIYFPLIERFAPEEGGSIRAAQLGHERMLSTLDDLQGLLTGGDRPSARHVLAQLLAGLNEHEAHEEQLIKRLKSA